MTARDRDAATSLRTQIVASAMALHVRRTLDAAVIISGSQLRPDLVMAEVALDEELAELLVERAGLLRRRPRLIVLSGGKED